MMDVKDKKIEFTEKNKNEKNRNSCDSMALFLLIVYTHCVFLVYASVDASFMLFVFSSMSKLRSYREQCGKIKLSALLRL